MLKVKENYAYILSAILVFISVFNLYTPMGKEHLICKWSLLIGLAVITAAYKIGRKYHWSLGLCLAYFGISSVYTFLWPMNDFIKMDNITRIIIGTNSAKSFIAVFASIVIVYLLKLKDLKKLELFFITITLLNSFVVVYQWLSGNTYMYRGGLFDNVSINSCIIAACYPLIVDLAFRKPNKETFLMLFPPVIAILCSMSSVGVGALAIGVTVYFFKILKNRWLKTLIPISLLIGIFSVGFLVDKRLFNDSERFKIYQVEYKSWIEYDNLLFGYGPGTFKYFGVKSQIENKLFLEIKDGKPKGAYFLWLHNDWLQLLLEGGIVGLALILLVTCFTVIYAWKIPHIFACLLAYMGSMVFHYPIHYPIHALFGLWIIAYIYLNKRERTT